MFSTVEQARRDAAVAAESGADLVEFRIDRIEDMQQLEPLLKETVAPAIVTCCPTREGGYCELEDEQRLVLLAMAGDHGAAYIDIELDRTRQ
jgi:3-dehydroquinate dehydratase type I